MLGSCGSLWNVSSFSWNVRDGRMFVHKLWLTEAFVIFFGGGKVEKLKILW